MGTLHTGDTRPVLHLHSIDVLISYSCYHVYCHAFQNNGNRKRVTRHPEVYIHTHTPRTIDTIDNFSSLKIETLWTSWTRDICRSGIIFGFLQLGTVKLFELFGASADDMANILLLKKKNDTTFVTKICNNDVALLQFVGLKGYTNFSHQIGTQSSDFKIIWACWNCHIASGIILIFLSARTQQLEFT